MGDGTPLRDRPVAAQAMYDATLITWLLDLRRAASPER